MTGTGSKGCDEWLIHLFRNGCRSIEKEAVEMQSKDFPGVGGAVLNHLFSYSFLSFLRSSSGL